MYGKPLAYIVKIKDIREIPGADRIELATVMDYTVVVKKNEYKPGDFGLYVEVDSVLPDDAEKFPFFEFLRDKKGLDTYFIKYDLKTEEATIEKVDNLFLPVTVPFSKLREELVKMDLWQARKEVHSSVLSKLDETI